MGLPVYFFLQTLLSWISQCMFISLQIQDPNLTKKSSQIWLDSIIIIHLGLHNLLPIQEMTCYHCGVFHQLICLFIWFQS